MPWEEEQTSVHAEARLELPDGAILQHSVFVVSYYDHEGNNRYGFNMSGESSLAQSLGLMDLVKAHMLAGVDRE